MLDSRSPTPAAPSCPRGAFDILLSRFGVMFFDDIAAAFNSYAPCPQAGRPGRFRLLAWRGRE